MNSIGIFNGNAIGRIMSREKAKEGIFVTERGREKKRKRE